MLWSGFWFFTLSSYWNDTKVSLINSLNYSRDQLPGDRIIKQNSKLKQMSKPQTHNLT